MIKAIIIDLDGTTLPRNWHQISEENRVALEEAGQQGVVRILATGRSVFSLNNTLPEGLPVDYMVFSSGAGIMRWDNKEILLTRELSAEETLDIATHLWKYDINFTIQQRIPTTIIFITGISPLFTKIFDVVSRIIPAWELPSLQPTRYKAGPLNFLLS